MSFLSFCHMWQPSILAGKIYGNDNCTDGSAMSAWDRQRDESGNLEGSLWYGRFTDFRLMGPDRSLLEIVNRWRDTKGNERQYSTPGAWSRNAEKWRWRKRAEAWDAELRRQRIKAEEKARIEMIERHVMLGRGLQQVGGRRLKLFDATPEDLTGSEARQYIKDGVAIERQARGLPEYLLAIAEMTDAELRNQYAALVGAITQPGGDGSGNGAAGDETASHTEVEDTAAV